MGDRGGSGSAARDGGRLFTGPFINVFIATFLQRTTSYMHIVLVPLYVIESGGSDFVAGLTTSVYTLAALVARPVAGAVVDRFGRYPAIILGTSLFAVAAALFAIELPIVVFLATRGLQGVGFSLAGTASTTLAADLIPTRRMTAGLGIFGLEMSLGQALGPPLAIWLQQTAGWSVAFLVAFALAAVGVLVRFIHHRAFVRIDLRHFARLRIARRRASSSAPEGRWRTMFEPSALRPGTIMLLTMIGSGAVSTFMAAHALARGVTEAGLFFTAMAVTVALSRLVVGRLQQVLGGRAVVATGIVANGAGLLLVFAVHDVATLVIAGLCYGAGLGLLQPTLMSRAIVGAPPERRGRAATTFFFAIDLSLVISGVLLGSVASVVGIAWTFPTAFVFVVAAFVIAVFVFRRPPAAKPGPR